MDHLVLTISSFEMTVLVSIVMDMCVCFLGGLSFDWTQCYISFYWAYISVERPCQVVFSSCKMQEQICISKNSYVITQAQLIFT